jgi:hypothetical protein
MSRGPGRLQRQIVELLKAQPDRRLSRRNIDAVLVERERHDSSNVLRAIRGLRRMRCIGLSEGRSLDDSFVSLPPPAKPVSDDKVFALLAKIGEANAAGAKR